MAGLLNDSNSRHIQAATISDFTVDTSKNNFISDSFMIVQDVSYFEYFFKIILVFISWIDMERFLVFNYSVSTLETTIFREIILLVRVNFRSTFFSPYLNPYFETLMGGNTHPLLPPIRMEKYRIK